MVDVVAKWQGVPPQGVIVGSIPTHISYMTAKEFIEKRLENLKTSPAIESELKSTKDLPDFIFRAITSKKFRKYKIIPETYTIHIKEAIENSIKNNIPIKLVFPFGGYKLWRLEETPEADWAELFTIMYLAKWLKPITEVYQPGVWFDFSSDDVIVERMNNIPKNDTESYNKSFNMILNFLKNYIPENMKFTLTPVSSHYTTEEFEQDLKDKIEKMQKELDGLPKLNKADIKAVELNVKLKPEQADDPLWREKVELIHQAYYAVSRRRAYNRAQDKILAFCTQISNCVAVGTTKTSIAKFWPGAGALKNIGEKFIETVLSPSQVETFQYNWEPISINGLDGKNFKKIRIINIK